MSQANQPTLSDTLAAHAGCVAVPGCWDGLSARLIEQSGFLAAFLSGGALAMARFGLPDMGFVSLTELAETTRAITTAINLPLIVDADAGFGNAINAGLTMRTLERAGAAAIILEDQTSPKRCGFIEGKSVISAPEAAEKIMAACEGRKSGHTLVIARTDAASIEGINAAIDRANLYVEAGADMVFVSGPASIADMALIHQAIPQRIALVHNMVGGGVNPIENKAQLDQLGFKIALHPLTLLSCFAHHADAALQALHDHKPISSAELSSLNTRVRTDDFIKTGLTYAD